LTTRTPSTALRITASFPHSSLFIVYFIPLSYQGGYNFPKLFLRVTLSLIIHSCSVPS
jgi:hypothetical protein